MTRPVADLVKHLWTGTGNGTMTLAGAVSGFGAFPSTLNGQVVSYSIEHENGSERETGIGTYTHSGTTLSRDLVTYSTTGAPAKHIFTPGNKHVRLTALGLDMVENRAPTDPIATDDIGSGYIAGRSRWLNTSSGALFFCTAHTAAAAAWQKVGNVYTVGTPANSQLGVWTGNGTLKGDPALTWDGAGNLYVASTTGPATIALHRDTTPTVNAFLGPYKFDGENVSGARITYAQIDTKIIATDLNAEKAVMNFYVRDGIGNLWQSMQLNNDQLTLQDADLDLYDAVASPTQGMYLDYMYFSSVNASQEYTRYATLQVQADSITVDQEAGSLQFMVMKNGTETITLEIDNTGVHALTGVLTAPSGTTASRPVANSVPAGSEFFDTTLSRPVWSNGSVWAGFATDAQGTLAASALQLGSVAGVQTFATTSGSISPTATKDINVVFLTGALTGTLTATLPTASASTNRQFIFVRTGGGQFDFQAGSRTARKGDIIQLISDGAAWQPIEESRSPPQVRLTAASNELVQNDNGRKITLTATSDLTILLRDDYPTDTSWLLTAEPASAPRTLTFTPQGGATLGIAVNPITIPAFQPYELYVYVSANSTSTSAVTQVYDRSGAPLTIERSATGDRTLGPAHVDTQQRNISGTANWTINSYTGSIFVDNITGGVITLLPGSGVTLNDTSIAAGKFATLIGRVNGTSVFVIEAP
jgi:hypothetical protein